MKKIPSMQHTAASMLALCSVITGLNTGALHANAQRKENRAMALAANKEVIKRIRRAPLEGELILVKKGPREDSAVLGDPDYPVSSACSSCDAFFALPCNLNLGGDVTIGGNLDVGGDEHVDGNLVVDGTITAIGGISGTFKDTEFAIVDATDATKKLQFDVQGNPGTTTTIVTNPTTNRTLTTTDYDGTLLAVNNDPAGGLVFINANAALHASNAGIQYNATFANRSQARFNQYGNNTGVPGITTFKSRNATIGGLTPVQAGDVIFRATAIGVTDNLSTPLSGFISINVPTGGVPAGQGYIATDYELQLVSLDGPANGRRVVYKMNSEGVPQLLESTSAGSHTTVPSGLITLDGTGNVTVANAKLAANARILLTIQPGPVPTGIVYVSNITANTGFTVTSTAGAGDTGLKVYYQIYTPLP